jgi:hypothetical protein
MLLNKWRIKMKTPHNKALSLAKFLQDKEKSAPKEIPRPPIAQHTQRGLIFKGLEPSRPNGFLAWIGNSNWASKISARFHCWLWALAPGDVNPTSLSSSQFKPMPKTHSTLVNVGRHGPRRVGLLEVEQANEK